MPTLTIRGSWYGGGCTVFSGEYDNLGSRSHTNFSLIQTGTGACGGYNFQVRDNTTNTIIYTSTSSAQDVALYFDGVQQSQSYDCINGACIQKNVYNTPGFYSSLEECESVCGLSPGCNGICISREEYAQIQQLISNLQSDLS